MYRLVYWIRQDNDTYRETHADFRTLEEAVLFDMETTWEPERYHNDELIGYGEHKDWYAFKNLGAWVLYHRSYLDKPPETSV